MLPVRLALVAAAIAMSPAAANALPVIFSVTGADAAAIAPTVDLFRADLGGLNPNPNPGASFNGGRREINWDGVPDARSAPNNLPADFFNVNSPRGVVFSTPGTGFQVSANAGLGTATLFGNLNPAYSSQFQAFSPQRLFSPLDSTVTDVSFFLPGSSTAALTRGFGAVFTDVDQFGPTTVSFFDSTNTSLGAFVVQDGPTRNRSLSFLGADFGTAVVSRVRIVSGNAVLGTDETLALDVVAMDDFIYGEPVPALIAQPIPEPGTTALLITGVTGAILAAPRRRDWGNLASNSPPTRSLEIAC